MKNQIDMYCVNCGKPIDGKIPLCRDCAILALQEQERASKLTEKVDYEAQVFSIDKEKELHTPSQCIQNQLYETIKKEENKDDDGQKALITFFITAIALVIFLGFIASLFSQ